MNTYEADFDYLLTTIESSRLPHAKKHEIALLLLDKPTQELITFADQVKAKEDSFEIFALTELSSHRSLKINQVKDEQQLTYEERMVKSAMNAS